MLPDWKEPEKLAEDLIVDSESNDETHFEDATSIGLPHAPGLQNGTIFAGHYEILGVLGHGGMSTVYKARHLLVDSVRAIKVIRSDQTDNSKVLRRFQQEGKATLALEHPNIGRVYEFGIEPALQKPYLVMDYIEGKTLAATLSEAGVLTTERACRLISQVCEGLQEAHSKGIIHRDIKPGNIILTKDSTGNETAKIVDFGIAKLIGPDEAQNLTQTGEVFGTPLYMSPEQCLGRKVDTRSDVYSLGCVFHECLVGNPPFQGSSAVETIMMHVNARPVIPKEADRAKSLILKSLEKSPMDRYQSMHEMRSAIQSVVCGKAPSPFAVPTQRRKLATWLLCGTSMMVVGLGILFLEILRKQNHNPMFLHLEFVVGPVVLLLMLIVVAWVNTSQRTRGSTQQAEALKPDYKPAWLGLGKILKKQGRSVDAEAAFRRADELKSDLEK